MFTLLKILHKVHIQMIQTCNSFSSLLMLSAALFNASNSACHKHTAYIIHLVLFSQALKNNHHVLHTLLPNKLEITYQLRHRSHNLTLPRKSGSTTKCDFITRMLFKDSYCVFYFIVCVLCYSCGLPTYH